ncbi:MAG TPA: glycosyltransferase family 39 protein, partial [Longimicrobiales bacterium]|nr:glycosyltransferase family 39 protein [Longimicrobiales bacterium]
MPARRLTTTALLGALLGLVFLQAFLSMRRKSLTYDELAYIPAGYSYVRTGDFRLNPEQPPLMKLLAGVALLPLDPRLPLEHESWTAAGEGVANTQWIFARAFFEANPQVERLVLAARVPTVLLTMLLVVGVFLFARALHGPLAGLLAAALCAFDPNVLAHGRLATTDLGLTCFTLWAVFAYHRLTRRPTAGRVAFAGAMLGLALLAKFSGLFLLALMPVFAVVLPFVRDGVVAPERWGGGRREAEGAGHVGDPPGGDGAEARRRLGWSLVATGAVVAVALMVVSLGYLAPGRANLYFRDFANVNVNVHAAFPSYFHGTFHEGRIPYYFLAAVLLKTPLALLILLALRAAAQVAERERPGAAHILLAAPVLAWLVIISWRAYAIGLRYVLPIYPFLFVYAAGIATSPWLRRRTVRLAVAALVAWTAGSSLAAHPHYLPYFNALAGGPERGIEWMDDSNVDWGQDLVLLRDFLDETGLEDVYVTPMAEYDPALYGVRARFLQPGEALRRLTSPDPPPGVYAI